MSESDKNADELMIYKKSGLLLEQNLLKNTIVRLIEEAMTVRYHSYAPYSDFYVGAALLTESGRIFTGVNVENASYPVGLCAERSAFAAAISAGERIFDAIAIYGGENGKEIGYCFPCGMCRQFMSELCGKDFRVIVAKSYHDYRIYQLKELLPYTFEL